MSGPKRFLEVEYRRNVDHERTSLEEVVQVLSADGKTPYAMFLSNAATRLEPSDHPEVSFMETAKGKPAAIHAWWYPGETTGYEFVYPEDQLRMLTQG